jgi:hypothetical protein
MFPGPWIRTEAIVGNATLGAAGSAPNHAFPKPSQTVSKIAGGPGEMISPAGSGAFAANAADGVFSAGGFQRGVKNREGKTREPVKTDAYYNITRSRKYAIFSCSGL